MINNFQEYKSHRIFKEDIVNKREHINTLNKCHHNSSSIEITDPQRSIDIHFTRLHNLTTDHHFIKDLVDLMKVENKIKFAHTAEILIEHFDKQVNEF